MNSHPARPVSVYREPSSFEAMEKVLCKLDRAFFVARDRERRELVEAAPPDRRITR